MLLCRDLYDPGAVVQKTGGKYIMVKAVVGANWGDEGKGKITDMLAEKADIIVRFQGGANAGHTIVNNYGKFALHTLPSGVFYNHTTSVIGNGVALNIPVFFKDKLCFISCCHIFQKSFGSLDGILIYFFLLIHRLRLL